MFCNNGKIRVLHVVRQMNRGGTEALLMNLLRTIDRDKFQFDFVEQTDECCEYDEEIISLGSRVYHSPHISLRNLHSYRMWWREFFKKHPEYRIVHGHSRGSAPVYLYEAKKAGCVIAVHSHNNSFGKGIRGFGRYIWQFPLRYMADYNFACSIDAGISQFGKKGKFTVIKNGIITEKYSWNPISRKRIREAYNIDDKFVVGNVARFSGQKNHFFLIDIFNEIQKRKPQSVLLLIGQGGLEERVRQQVSKFNLEEKVIFAGVRPDVEDYLQAMDVFVLPSLFEGLGIVNIEAQAAGLPCFVSADVIPAEIDLTDLVHHISLKKSPSEWAEQILDNQIPLENRKSRTEEIKNGGYDIEDTAKLLCEFYEEMSK